MKRIVARLVTGPSSSPQQLPWLSASGGSGVLPRIRRQ
jgi:hypothetical protein